MLLTKDKSVFILLTLLVLQLIVNLVGALGPELAFDALWYHLTLPKLYLLNHKIFYIPGGLLYYSAMPKLGEMFYITGLALQGEILAKLIHFTFGILSIITVFLFSRQILSGKTALLVAVIYYSNLVVAWESITAYIDLARTFYEINALWAFVLWWKNGKRKMFYLSAVMTGFAIATKLLAVGSLGIFTILIAFKTHRQRKPITTVLSGILAYWIITMSAVMPWLIFSYNLTGNPIYPLFGGYKTDFTLAVLSPLRFLDDLLHIFLFADDPIFPVYFIILPLIPLIYKKLRMSGRVIVMYSFISFLIWYFTPRTGGGRFILPYLPAFSIVAGAVISLSARTVRRTLIISVVLASAVSILYRGVANSKYLPVIFGCETHQVFLAKNLNFSYGDFYDTDNYFKKKITDSDIVLLYGFHNLYYVNFPYIDASWVRDGDKFNYVAVQHTQLPRRYQSWEFLYENKITGVKLYTDNNKFNEY